MLWVAHFPHLHDEARSAVLDASHRAPAFDRFLSDQLAKLVLSRGRRRYVAKANYNLTRLGYLLDLFPDARFVVLVRHPREHFVSYLKQQRVLSGLYASDARWWLIARELGHYEFGEELRFVNAGCHEAVQSVRAWWEAGEQARAFGLYWSSLYGFLADALHRDEALRQATLVVRYEDLCDNSAATIDRIIAHTGLDPAPFADSRDHFVSALRRPDYYEARLEEGTPGILWEQAGETAARFGYGAGGPHPWEGHPLSS